MSECTCNIALPPRLLRGVTRTVRVTVVDKADNPVDLTVARNVVVTVSLDGAGRSEAYVPGISIQGDDNNVVEFAWYADVQRRCGRYTIDINADFGNRNQSRVDFHREFGVELVEHSCDVSGEPAEAMEVDDDLDLEGTLEVTTDGMSAFDQWRTSPESEGYPPTEEGFFAWMRQPATDAAADVEAGEAARNAAEAQRVAAEQAREAQAASDHSRAASDHTTAASDHSLAAADHVTAWQDHTQAGSDHDTAATDHTQAGSDHTRAASDHGTAASDHTLAGTDHSTAASDHTQAGNDHTRAESDHTRAEQDHTRAEQDHASVGEAVKYTAQTLTAEQQAQARTNIEAGTYSKPSGGIPASDLASGVIPTVPTISTDIASDATSDTKTASPKAVKTFVEGKGYGTYSKPSGGIPASDLASGVIPTVPTISTDIQTDKASTTKTASPSAVYNEVHPAVATTQPQGGFLPNVVYDLGTITGTVTFALASATDNTIANHYYWTFETSSTAPTITWPSGLSWYGGSAPTINASKHYEISVLNGIGVAMEV